MDIKSPEERSKNMAAIHSKNTKPEIYLRKQLFSIGYRYGINSKSVSGHPDIYLKRYNTAIFVHGCYWHRHQGCKYSYIPKTRVNFWQKKFGINQKRDEAVRQKLSDIGIKQVVVWECTIKKMQKQSMENQRVIQELKKFFESKEMFLEL